MAFQNAGGASIFLSVMSNLTCRYGGLTWRDLGEQRIEEVDMKRREFFRGEERTARRGFVGGTAEWWRLAGRSSCARIRGERIRGADGGVAEARQEEWKRAIR